MRVVKTFVLGTIILFAPGTHQVSANGTKPSIEACFACYWEVCDASGSSHWDDTEIAGTRKGSGTHSSCSSGSCSGHDACAGNETDEENAQALLQAYDVGDHETVAETIIGSKGKIYLNHERGSIQAIGCSGSVDINLPISSQEMSYVERAVASIVQVR